MGMIATYTVLQARHKQCHRDGACIAGDCMAWQWARSARLSCSTGLLPRYAESAFEGYQGNGDPEMPDLNAANFYQPVGDGWRFSTFEAGDDGWEAHWERDTDPEQQGYCAALQHPMAMSQKLDGILSALCAINGE